MSAIASMLGDRRYVIEAPWSLRLLGDPVLRVVCTPVEKAEDIPAGLIGSMHAICRRFGGLGLGANQAGGTVRVFVARLDSEDMREFVNPRIVGGSDATLIDTEGCLSIPGFQTSVRRHASVTLEWTDAQIGPMQRRRLSGLDARVVQHEIDHLDGRLIIDGVSRQQRRLAERCVAAEITRRASLRTRNAGSPNEHA